MKRKTIMFLTMIFTVVFSAIASSYIVNADELDGYTKVDWSWNRDMETTDVNFCNCRRKYSILAICK